MSVLLLGVLALSAAACGRAQQAGDRAHADDTTGGFAETADGYSGAVQLASVQTGQPLRTLAPGTRDGLSIDGVARLSPSSLLLTYDTGPRCSSDVSGCGPRPDTCGGEVDRLDLTSGVMTRLWSVGEDELVRGAVPNPAGTEFAAVVAPCVPSYFNEHWSSEPCPASGAGASAPVRPAATRCHPRPGTPPAHTCS